MKPTPLVFLIALVSLLFAASCRNEVIPEQEKLPCSPQIIETVSQRDLTQARCFYINEIGDTIFYSSPIETKITFESSYCLSTQPDAFVRYNYLIYEDGITYFTPFVDENINNYWIVSAEPNAPDTLAFVVCPLVEPFPSVDIEMKIMFNQGQDSSNTFIFPIAQ